MVAEASRGLVGRVPQVPADRLVADLRPPSRFADVSFGSYRPDPAHPSQAGAVAAVIARADRLARPPRRGLLRPRADTGSGLYLDGGFGVGKTHLLASLFHAVAPGTAAYGTFVEYTHLVGALGFAASVERLGSRRLVCIDEFELDDPGDTVLMARLVRELLQRGVTVAATSNTLPDALGEGRFAAEDFLREIQALAAAFDVVRIDGPDYRHRGRPAPPAPATAEQVDHVATLPGGVVDDFRALLAHLATVHPSRYGALLDGVATVGWHGVAPVGDQNVALRAVVLADRLYDRRIPVVASGRPVTDLFPAGMLAGGYRKKYLRALSRLADLVRDGSDLPLRG